MGILIRLACIACLFCCSTGLGAQDQAPEPLWMRARIALDTEGKLVSIEWLGVKPSVVTAALEAEVRQWVFVPGMVNGVPAPTQTGLTLEVILRPAATGLALQIGDAVTGAVTEQRIMPRYPQTQAMKNVEGQVTMNLSIDPSGAVTAVAVTEFRGTSNSSTTRKQFEAAAVEAARQWTFHTEQVAGRPQGGTASLAMMFCVSNGCAKRVLKRAPVGAYGQPPPLAERMPANMPIALDSKVKIKQRSPVLGI